MPTINTHLGYSSRGSGRANTPTTKRIFNFGRVVDVILDDSHPRYEEYGQSQAINGVFYRLIDQPYDQSTSDNLPFAYQAETQFKQVPVLGEIVHITNLASEARQDAEGDLPTQTKTYWDRIVPIWNAPHHNAYPQLQDDDNDFGEFFEPREDISPLQPYPGDILIEGRFGNSIRLTGARYIENPWVDDSNNGSALTIIANGQTGGDGMANVVENINDDANSIYMAEDHTIELTPANTKQEAYSEKPEEVDKYKGNQVLINAGRLVFNAKDNDYLVSATGFVGMNGNTVSLDGAEYVAVDATKVYLGTAAFREQQPVLLGELSTGWLEQLCTQIETLCKTLGTPNAPPPYVAAAVATAKPVEAGVAALRGQLDTLKSLKVFTE